MTFYQYDSTLLLTGIQFNQDIGTLFFNLITFFQYVPKR